MKDESIKYIRKEYKGKRNEVLFFLIPGVCIILLLENINIYDLQIVNNLVKGIGLLGFLLCPIMIFLIVYDINEKYIKNWDIIKDFILIFLISVIVLSLISASFFQNRLIPITFVIIFISFFLLFELKLIKKKLNFYKSCISNVESFINEIDLKDFVNIPESKGELVNLRAFKFFINLDYDGNPRVDRLNYIHFSVDPRKARLLILVKREIESKFYPNDSFNYYRITYSLKVIRKVQLSKDNIEKKYLGEVIFKGKHRKNEIDIYLDELDLLEFLFNYEKDKIIVIDGYSCNT